MMAKELLIAFLYDTKLQLKENDDPQNAILYFHPSWVSYNQRMALCGQIVGVSQFLVMNFSFPRVISLSSGKFAVKTFGRFILCVGTDHNISDWVLEKRCRVLYETIQFYHKDLNKFCDHEDRCVVVDRLMNIMELYLPVLLCAGNVFGNNPTITLPRSATGIFMEASQILQCLQDKDGVYGGAILYQNKVVMSQMSPNLTKQIVITDPCRVKLPLEHLDTSFHKPIGVQLVIVYVDERELEALDGEKLPAAGVRKNMKMERDTTHEKSNGHLPRRESSRIFTLVEEDSDCKEMQDMPDLVRDAVLKKPSKLDGFRMESYMVDGYKANGKLASGSMEHLEKHVPVRYFSLVNNDSSIADVSTPTKTKSRKSKFLYYNTISDPSHPWFRFNGMPVSKFFHDSQMDSYYNDIAANIVPDPETSVAEKEPANKPIKRPTSIKLMGNGVKNSEKSRRRKLLDLNLNRDLQAGTQRPENSGGNAGPLTPLMAHLSIADKVELPYTPLNSRINCDKEFVMSTKGGEKVKMNSHRKKDESSKLVKSIMYIFGHQNLSLYLLLQYKRAKDPDLIHFLWKICFSSLTELECHFQQCLETIPQTQSFDGGDSYGYMHSHTDWETLKRGGEWTKEQLNVAAKLLNDFNTDDSMVEVTVRSENDVVYGYQMADQQAFYQQEVASVHGLPMPSDLMATVPMKAKRRLERDHGVLLL